LKSVETNIIISQSSSLILNELLVFPHLLDGLHIWEAGIILGRYIYYNSKLFSEKSILELGTGVGIGGISALKFASPQAVIMTDWKNEILENAKQNCLKNCANV